MTGAAGTLVAIGVGNVLLGDDAAGVRVIEELRVAAARDPGTLPAGTRLVDGGTLGLDLLAQATGARGLVLVDAVRLGGPAGRVRVLRGEAILAAGGTRDGTAISAVGELLAVGRLMGWLPAEVALVGIEAADLGPGPALTPAVGRAVQAAMDAVRDELRRMDMLPASDRHPAADRGRIAGASA